MRPFAPGSVRSVVSRFVGPVPTPQPIFCRQCFRPLSTTPMVQSGHNKWSKIKHKKGAADAQKNSMRSQHSKTIALYSRLYGTTDNPQLTAAVATAKKEGVPKHIIDSAIARGQGRSATGASLESLTLEAIIPPGVALIIEVETESKARSLQDLKVLIKKHKGSTNTATFFFTRLGRVVFEAKQGTDIDDIMDDAIEAGAEDLEADEEGNMVVWTQPNMTTAVANGVGPKFGLNVLNSEIIWSANEDTKVTLDGTEEATVLGDLLGSLQELPEVQAIYGNPVKGSISEDLWSKIEDSLDS
ncbi:putative transcriptional regulatory protein [Colletotrichum sidae]|uniref:Putative transcriptional regulatory protein n=1 Tax=Colletotrichum sidae TaxID=1347389 RepID=A0A4R8TTN5_9PEZI|nr:putative transcriptional regulatory protein [Colletotrichum sidae]